MTAPNLWLAIGDETGPFDDPNSADFQGAGMVLARPQDFDAALDERIYGKTVRQRMNLAIEGLESRLQALGSEKESELAMHHVREVWQYFREQKLHGTFRLDATPQDPVLRHLLAAFQWLAGHPRLISIGICGSGRELFGEFWKGSDSMSALGALYGRALAVAKPFLGPNPRIRVLAGVRKERVDSSAIKRSGQNVKRPAQIVEGQKDDRQSSSITGGNRTLLDAMESEFWNTLGPMEAYWPVPGAAKARHVVFSAFTEPKALRDSLATEDPAASRLISGDSSALGSLADLACSLMAISQNPKGDVRIDLPRPIGPNVRFFTIREIAR